MVYRLTLGSESDSSLVLGFHDDQPCQESDDEPGDTDGLES